MWMTFQEYCELREQGTIDPNLLQAIGQAKTALAKSQTAKSPEDAKRAAQELEVSKQKLAQAKNAKDYQSVSQLVQELDPTRKPVAGKTM